MAIGAKVKALRTEKKMTLKQLSEGSGLSVGFLSQFERGLSSIALDSLEKLSEILDSPLSELFEEHTGRRSADPVVHGIDLQFTEISPRIYQSILRTPDASYDMLPRVFTLFPFDSEEDGLEMYSHEGEEFIMVMEGIMEISYGKNTYLLEEGDSIYYDSIVPHHVHAYEGQAAKILAVVYTPI